MDGSYISKIENGHNPNIGLDRFERIRAALGVNRDVLLLDPNEPVTPVKPPYGTGRDRSLGAAIHTERNKRGLSITKAAKAGDVSHPTWTNIEEGRQVRYASYYGVDGAFELEHGHTAAVFADNNRPISDLFHPDGTAPESAVSVPENRSAFRACLGLIDQLTPAERAALRELLTDDREDGTG